MQIQYQKPNKACFLETDYFIHYCSLWKPFTGVKTTLMQISNDVVQVIHDSKLMKLKPKAMFQLGLVFYFSFASVMTPNCTVYCGERENEKSRHTAILYQNNLFKEKKRFKNPAAFTLPVS